MLATSFKPKFIDHIEKALPKAQDVVDPSDVLAIDGKTRDNWVPRDDRLVRLTGSHPMNAEPPITILHDYGFITPRPLHFVRNHGYVTPIKIADPLDWTIKIDGKVSNPQTFTIGKLQELFEAITLPVTLSCPGNRRKEQNLVQKTKAFDWGAGGISTSLFTGVLLCDLLDYVKPLRSAKYVIFEGHEDLPNGKYATGVRLHMAKDWDRGLMLAWKQNGQPLAPDHGWPLRMIIPGVAGGRWVKWLSRITISDTPPDGWYHKYDNRVLPTNLPADTNFDLTDWWHDERYAIYDLNLQSVTVYPEHNSILPKNSEKQTYTVKGYAYNGGGVQISRVEVSLDAGKTWIEASVRYPEIELRHMCARGEISEMYGGKMDLADRYLTFCWCFWEVDIPTSQIFESSDIVVRAMDTNMMSQPRDIYWNMLGMVTNWWFRVAIYDEGDHVKFKHPTSLKASDGWMDDLKRQGKNPAKWYEEITNKFKENDALIKSQPEEVKMVRDEMLSVIITPDELKSHPNWFVVKGQVYDGTDYLKAHPGGADSISMVSGEDATDDFMAIHSEKAKKMLSKYHIGRLDPKLSTSISIEPTIKSVDLATGGNFLEPKKWKPSVLLQKRILSPDTRLFDFALSNSDQLSGLKVGQHVLLRLKSGNKRTVVRAYTPLSCHRTPGVISLLVKIYFPLDNIPGGKMSMLLEELNINETVEFKGPSGSFNYLGKGNCIHSGKQLHFKKLYMVCGGTGITPCYQIIKELAYDSTDPTRCHLLFGNRDYEHILCRDDLERFKIEAAGRIEVDYYLTQPSKEIDFDNSSIKYGLINQDTLNDVFRQDLQNGDAVLMACGPQSMLDFVKGWVRENNIGEDSFVVF